MSVTLSRCLSGCASLVTGSLPLGCFQVIMRQTTSSSTVRLPIKRIMAKVLDSSATTQSTSLVRASWPIPMDLTMTLGRSRMMCDV